ncbi:MAG: anti-sigma factor antagonist, partial [Planctomycetota bacterium]|nr:anti-sigma factor antagonist [Planctomycetota bacterium]
MAGLQIKFRPLDKESAMALAELTGVIDGQTIPKFQSTLDEYQKKGIKRLILDMSKISYVNSTGLGSLVKYAEVFENAGGGLALLKLPAKVRIVIEMLGLKSFFSVCETLEEAQQALGGAALPEQAQLAEAEDQEVVQKNQLASSGPVSYPLFVNCKSCAVKLEFHKAGSYKCPRCHTAIQLNDSNGPHFTKPTGDSALSLSLPAR